MSWAEAAEAKSSELEEKDHYALPRRQPTKGKEDKPGQQPQQPRRPAEPGVPPWTMGVGEASGGWALLDFWTPGRLRLEDISNGVLVGWQGCGARLPEVQRLGRFSL